MKKLILYLLFTLPLLSYAQRKITSRAALDSLTRNNNAQLLDVRTPEEYNIKHLEKSLNINWKDSTQFDSLVFFLNKDKPIYIYCRTGVRSAAAAKKLTEQGFEVYDIEGGIVQWEKDSLPLMSESEQEVNTDLSYEDYKKIINKEKTVLVFFYSSSCQTGRKLEPAIFDFQNKQNKNTKT